MTCDVPRESAYDAKQVGMIIRFLRMRSAVKAADAIDVQQQQQQQQQHELHVIHVDDEREGASLLQAASDSLRDV